MIIFEVSGGVRSCLTGFGWAIPVISIGTLPGTLTNSEISTTHCVRALESAARKIQHVDIGSRLLSESHEYSTVLLSTLDKIQWKDAILVYDDETGRQCMQDIIYFLLRVHRKYNSMAEQCVSSNTKYAHVHTISLP